MRCITCIIITIISRIPALADERYVATADYLIVEPSDASVNSCYPTILELNGKRLQVRVINGSVSFIVAAFQGENASRYYVDETTGENKFRVIYDLKNDKNQDTFSAIVSRLSLRIGLREIETEALMLRPSNLGGSMRKAKEPSSFRIADAAEEKGGGWLLESVSMDELACFIERKMRRIVVNDTDMKGKYSIALPKGFFRQLPADDEIKTFADNGLELKWEKRKILLKVITK